MKYAISFTLATIVSGVFARSAARTDELRKPMIFEHQRIEAIAAVDARAAKLKKRQNSSTGSSLNNTGTLSVSVSDSSDSVSPNFYGSVSNATIINMSNSTMNLYSNGQQQAAPQAPQSNAALWQAACNKVLAATSAQYPMGYAVDPTFGPMYGVVEKGTQLGCMIPAPGNNSTQYMELVYPCLSGATCVPVAYLWGPTEYKTICCTYPACTTSAIPSATPTASASATPQLGCPVDDAPAAPCQTGVPVCTPAASCGTAAPVPTASSTGCAIPAPPPKTDAGVRVSVGIPFAVAIAAIVSAAL